jgi:signal transduction histidine kinase/DNA-binding response OmpR family regulator
MAAQRRQWWRDARIQTKMLAVILPLIVIPTVMLSVVGFIHTTGVIAGTFLVIPVLSLGLTLLCTITWAQRLTGPMRRLAEAAHRIAAGQQPVAVVVDSEDELGRLAAAFNDMAAGLAHHEAALQRKVDETTTLYEIGQEITAQVALAPTLRLIVERAYQLLQAEGSLLALRQGDSDTFAMQAHSGTGPPALTALRIRPGEGLGGRIVETGLPIVVGDYLTEYLDSPFLGLVREGGCRSLVAVPLKARDAVIGVLYVQSQVPHKFRDEDRQLLAALADQAAIAIDNAKLYQQVSQHTEELEAKVNECTRELEEANRKLASASHHKSAFLANMSHELRTPMNAIIGFARLVLRRAKDVLPKREHENLEKILISAEHLLSLINNILDLAKIEAGHLEISSSSFALEPLVDLCLRSVEPLVKNARLQLAKEIETDLPPLCTDQGKVQQILVNLLSNAVKFTPEGAVTVTARRRAEEIAISVADTGIGIPAPALSLIFEEFHQVDSSSTRQYSGMGLGLSISRHLARLLGGDITVQSTLGCGSTFTVTLPLHYHAASLTTRVALAPSPAEPVLQPRSDRVLLAIDDDPDVLYLLGENLAEAGYRVVGAVSGEEGLQKARALRPFAITLDILMPHKDGWQILHALKADVATRDIPIIVLSIVDNKVLGYRLGAFDYLLKPFEREAILGALARIPPRRGRLLVIDDDPQVADLVRQLLAGEPYEVVTAADGQAALEVIARQHPDVVLLDLLMARMEAFAVIEHLRQDAQYSQIPIIALTATTLTTAERAALEQSVRTVIQKQGLERDALLQELRNLLQAYYG